MGVNPKVSENDVKKSIMDYLAYRPGKYWRQNTGLAQFGKRYVRFSINGAADITGVRPPHGQRVEIETKRPGKKQSPDQVEFQAMIEAEGGLYVLADDLDDVIKAGL